MPALALFVIVAIVILSIYVEASALRPAIGVALAAAHGAIVHLDVQPHAETGI